MFCCCQQETNLENKIFENLKNLKITKTTSLLKFEVIIKSTVFLDEENELKIFETKSSAENLTNHYKEMKKKVIKEGIFKSLNYDYNSKDELNILNAESNNTYENLHIKKLLEISEYKKYIFFLNTFPFLNYKNKSEDKKTIQFRANEFCKLIVKIIFQKNMQMINPNEILMIETNDLRNLLIEYTKNFLNVVYKPYLEISGEENLYDDEINMRFKVAFKEENISKFVDKTFLFLSSDDEIYDLNSSLNNNNISNISLVKKNFEEDKDNISLEIPQKKNKNSRNNSAERSFSWGKNYSINQKYGSISINELRNFIEVNKYFMKSVLFLKEILKFMERERVIRF